MKNHVVWFDIPVVNLDRAMKFYSEMLAVDIKKDWPDMPVGVFDHGQDSVSGCLYVDNEGGGPSDRGPLLYLNANGRLDDAIAKVEVNGGKILKPKHQIGPYGYRCIVRDSEGNRVALHSEA